MRRPKIFKESAELHLLQAGIDDQDGDISYWNTPPSLEPDKPGNSGSCRAIKLASGGTLTLSASLNFLALTPTDRKFFSDLIDRLDEYEKGVE